MNHLWVVLDSVSYKVFMQSASPNIRKLGAVEKVISHGCWTLPAIMGMFYVPYLCGKPMVSLEYRYHKWLPVEMQREGYSTTLISDNPWFEVGQGYISEGFDNYVTLGKLGCSEQIVQGAIEHLTEKFFMVLWFTATHIPFYYPGKEDGLSHLVHRLNSIEYVDSLLGSFLEKIPSETQVVVTSDHGNAWKGEVCIGHNPKFVPVCQDTHYNIFYVSGMVGGKHED